MSFAPTAAITWGELLTRSKTRPPLTQRKRPDSAAVPNLPQPEILAETNGWLAVNKPGGVLTQAPPGIDSIETRVRHFLRSRDNRPGKVYLGLPHRLDRPASGVLLLAKNPRSAKQIAAQFRERSVRKHYWAVVAGDVQPNSGSWQDTMRKIPDQAKSEICGRNAEGAQQALLDFRVIQQRSGLSWLRIELQTGRTHQIRLQSSSRSHPIIGDHLYGSETEFGPQSTDQRKRWIALHARQLEFTDPKTGDPVSVTAELCEHWQSLPFDLTADALG